MIKEEIKKLHEAEIGNIYSAKTLAEALNCSSRLIHYFRSKGKLKSVNTTRNRFLFVKEDVVEFLKEKGYANR
jgi:predicted site-specific integrase-resolvase